MSGAGPLQPPPGTAVLRRYRTGSGEASCWLLAATGDEGVRYCVLDDRALLAADPPPRATEIASHLAAATGGRVDLLVATGVGDRPGAAAALEGLEIAELWLPWTVDPADPAARRLRRDHAAGATTLRRAAERLDAVDPGNAAPGGAPSAEHLRQVAAALPRAAAGPAPAATGGSASADGRDGDDAGRGDAAWGVAAGGDARRGDAGGDDAGGQESLEGRESQRAGPLARLARRVRFRRAGDTPPDELLPGLRLRVLAPADAGPAVDATDPASAAGPAMAEPEPRFSPAASLFAAALADPAGLPLAPEDRAIQQLDRPFDLVYSIPYETAANDEDWGSFFRAHYGFADGSGNGPGDGPAWRRVDADWLGTAAQLAFQLAAETEAAGLAVALELGGKGAVLRFPPRHDSPPPPRQLTLPPPGPQPWTDHPLPLG